MNNRPPTILRGVLLSGIAVGIVFLVVQCHQPDPNACRVAWRAAEIFHQQFNDLKDHDVPTVHAGDEYPGLYEYLHDDYVRGARSKLGPFTSTRMKQCKTSRQAVGTYVFLTLDSQFERGAATEKFNFIANPSDDPTTATLTGYIVESPLLPAP